MTIEKLNSEEVAFICNQIHIILDSGVSLDEGLEVLLEDTKNKYAKNILVNIIEGIEKENSLYKVLEKSRVFPKYMINMVRIGEATGKLEEVFGLLAKYYSTEDELKKTIKSALFRPVVLLIMMFFVVAVLVMKIIPTFSQIFEQLNIQVSNDFNNTMKLSMNMGLIVLITITVIIGILLISMLLANTYKGKEVFITIADKFIFTRNITEKIAVSRFCMAMTLMVKSGVDTTEALEYVQDVVASRKIKKKIKRCHKNVLDNKSFVDSIVDEKILSNMHNQMLKVSYKTGAYEGTWDKISDINVKEVDESLEDILQAIEPITITIMTIVIGAVLISVMLPLMGIMTSI